MRLLDVVLISLSITFLVIGVHQSMTVGFENAYWLLMLATALFLLVALRKKK